jgi:hypothetical protein
MKGDNLFEMNVEEMEEDIKKVQKAFEQAEEAALKAIQNEIASITFDLLGEGMRRAPIYQGYLRGSGIAKLNGKQTAHTESSRKGDAKIVKDFKAGNISLQTLVNKLMGEIAFTAEYATIQHENQEFKHPKGGEAKYLENPLKEKYPLYMTEIVKAIENALDKGGL